MICAYDGVEELPHYIDESSDTELYSTGNFFFILGEDTDIFGTT